MKVDAGEPESPVFANLPPVAGAIYWPETKHGKQVIGHTVGRWIGQELQEGGCCKVI